MLSTDLYDRDHLCIVQRKALHAISTQLHLVDPSHALASRWTNRPNTVHIIGSPEINRLSTVEPNFPEILLLLFSPASSDCCVWDEM